MSIWRATLRLEDGCGLPLSIEDGTTVMAVVRQMVADPLVEAESTEGALSALLAWEREGALSLEGPEDSPSLAEVRALVDALDRHLEADPGLHNVVGDHRAWSEDPEHYDFVTAESDLGRLKRFERDLYLSHLDSHLRALPKGAYVLDAGCGPGRFVAPLLARGMRLHLVDANKDALHRALAHGLEAGASKNALDGHVADIDSLEAIEDETFDAVLSIEVICYRGDPARALAELTRVTRSGGLVMLSVEGLYGALIAHEGPTPAQIEGALSASRFSATRDVHVTYYTADTLRAMMVEVGLEPLLITGCHYVPEGPFGHALDLARLDEPSHREAILSLEATCAADPSLAPMARAWIAVGRRP